MKRLENKVAIISGAARGIGYATAEKFLEEGAKVVICDMDADGLLEAAGQLSKKVRNCGRSRHPRRAGGGRHDQAHRGYLRRCGYSGQ